MHKLTFGIKLLLAFGCIAGLAGALLFYQSRLTTRVQAQYENTTQHEMKRLDGLEALAAITLDADRQTLLHEQNRITAGELQAKLAEMQKSTEANEETFHAHTTGIESSLSAADVATLHADTVKLLQKAMDITNAPKTSALARTGHTELSTMVSKLSQRINQAIIQENAIIADQTKRIKTATAGARTLILIAAGGLIAITLGLGVYFVRFLNRALAKLKKGATRLANGDFSQNIPVGSGDQFGEVASAFNQMADRLKDSYKRLALEKQRDEALLQSMGEGVIAIDEKANIVMVNNVASELLDIPKRDEVLGTSLFKAYRLFTAKGTRPIARQSQPAFITLKTGLPSSEVFTFHHSDDKKTLLNISTYPVVLDEKTVGVIMIIRDVTKEKEIDRMKTEFISLASHQLRTPLSAIRWFTEMLIAGDAGKLTNEQKEFAQNISDSTQRMIELVNSLLNISRIESGRIIIDPKPTDLNELVSGIVNDLKAKTEERQQTLIVSVHKSLGKINLDPRLIGQVYLNFLTNAVKYTPKGGEISVFISRKDKNVVSQISDNGYGIPKAQQGKLFQKFFRAANVAKFETDGTGLGLYLVKAIIESSGGKVWYKSEEGKGSTFWFSLPMSGMKAQEGEVTLDR